MDETVDRIIAAIAAGGDFWHEVYEPYSENRISRETVRMVIEKARERAGKSMPRVAHYLKAVEGDEDSDPEARKMLFRFKNFLYKTVKLS